MHKAVKNSGSSILAGLLFAIFWGSASTITKFGLQYLQPWVLAVCRLLTASVIMLLITHLILGYALPERKHWKILIIYGLLNLGIFLGLYTYALQFVLGGLGTLMTSTLPIFITLFSGLWLKQKIYATVIFSLFICFIGVFIAAWPMIQSIEGSVFGMLILLIGIISNAAGAIYFVGTDWNGLKLLTINTWQTLIGALFLLPLSIYFYDSRLNDFTWQAMISVGWLSLFVSILAVLLWLYILSQNPIRAAFWLFLCPIIGFGLAAFLLHEPLTRFTAVGIIFVLTGLYLSRRNT